jgi:hypothetical protein
MNAPQGGTMPWTDDLDQICSYLTSVGTGGKGIKGAVVVDADGLIWGLGADSPSGFVDLAPRMVGWLQECALQAQRDQRPDPEFFLLQDQEDFHFCKKFFGCYYVVVSGSRGSFELFQGRIDRCVQMAESALKERKSP